MTVKKSVQAEILETAPQCSQTLREIYETHQFLDVHREIIESGIRAINRAIAELAIATPEHPAKSRALVKDLLHDLHRHAKYRYDEKIIRDLADIALTMRNVLNGDFPSGKKLGEAHLFFVHARLYA